MSEAEQDADVETAARGGDAPGYNWRAALRALSSEPLPPRLRTALAELGVYGHRLHVAAEAYGGRVTRAMTDPEERDLPVLACRAWPEYAEREEALRAYTDARSAVSVMSRAWVEGRTRSASPETDAPPAAPAASVSVREALLAVEVRRSSPQLVLGVEVSRDCAWGWRIGLETEGLTPYASTLDQATALVLETAARASEGGAFALAVASELAARFPGPAEAVRREVLGAGPLPLDRARGVVRTYFAPPSLAHLSPRLRALLAADREAEA